MFWFLNKTIFGLIITAFCFCSMGTLEAAPRKSTSCIGKSSSKQTYTKKAPYAGYGKPSKANGLPKTKITSGHMKKTNKGCTYVNPYARSK